MTAICALWSRAETGLDAPPVRVETHLSPGLPGFTMVGLPETAVKESRDRVRSALLNSGFQFPQRRITVNLAPADLPKRGARFDLPIALGILVASGQLPPPADPQQEYLGELALSGELCAVRGVLPAALAARDAGHRLVLPAANGAEASLVGGPLQVATHLRQVCAALKGLAPLPAPDTVPWPAPTGAGPCLSEVRGQAAARRALEVAAAGGHSLLLSGPPGSGKSMLAERLPGLLPPLDDRQALEVAAIHSLLQRRPHGTLRQPPFRAPHHTLTAAALVGGGSPPRPGEVSLAHHGVLFLDELPEFDRRVLETLREPLETGQVHVARALWRSRFPARFQLVAAMNPCPCGWLNDPERACAAQCDRARRYRQRLSGPLLDRIDLHVTVAALTPRELVQLGAGEASTPVRERVLQARDRQFKRQDGLNAALDRRALAPILSRHQHWLEQAAQRLRLSARALLRLLRVARTLADLGAAAEVDIPHLVEALSYRQFDEQA